MDPTDAYPDFEFVTTEGDVRPTKENSKPVVDGDQYGRGSLVYFNQATMFQTSETGFDTLQKAKEAGHSGTTDFEEDTQRSFATAAHFTPIIRKNPEL